MRVPVRAIYGIMAAVDLALQNRLAPVQARAIAKRQGIPARFLEQVLHAMKKAGLIESVRGAQGGYLLTQAPKELSLAQILEALEGPLLPANETPVGHGQRRGVRPLGGASLLASVWQKVAQAEYDVLNTITLQDLVDQHRVQQADHALMFHI